MPDKEAARALLDINLRGVKVAEDLDRDGLAERLAGYSGADVTNVRAWTRQRGARARERGAWPGQGKDRAGEAAFADGCMACLHGPCGAVARPQICRDASMMAMRRRIEGLTPAQIKALSKGPPCPWAARDRRVISHG